MSIKGKTRSIIRDIYLSTAGYTAVPANGIHILNGHKICKEPGHGTKVDCERFDNLLCMLEKYCDLIDFENAVDLIVNREAVSRPAVAFSFDDGYEDCYYGIAPVLEKHGVNAMFFINPSAANAAENNDMAYIDRFVNISTRSPGKRPMTWQQIRELRKRGFMIGAHTMDHCMTTSHGCQDDLRHQICDCRDMIENKLGFRCEYFAWPYGTMAHINNDGLNIALRTYKYVFSQTDFKHYLSLGGKVINRRHFEPWWKHSHVRYFLSFKKI